MPYKDSEKFPGVERQYGKLRRLLRERRHQLRTGDGDLETDYELASITFNTVNTHTPILGNNQLTIDDILHIEKLFAEKNRSKYLLAGDIVTVRTGNAGISAVIPSSLDKSQCFTLLISTPRPNQIAQFYCYYLNSKIIRDIKV